MSAFLLQFQCGDSRGCVNDFCTRIHFPERLQNKIIQSKSVADKHHVLCAKLAHIARSQRIIMRTPGSGRNDEFRMNIPASLRKVPGQQIKRKCSAVDIQRFRGGADNTRKKQET